MIEIPVAISAAAGLVTLGTFAVFFWRLVQRPKQGDVVPEDVISALEYWQDDWEKAMGDVSLPDSWKIATGDETLTRAMRKLTEGFARSSSVFLTEEEQQKIETWLRLAEFSEPLRHPPFAVGQHSSQGSTPPRLRFLGRHLPKELQPHKKEILHFLEDGLADLSPKKRKRFLFSQYFSLAIYIGKTPLFKISKTWRRTIR